jgi:hypothetical protein
MSDAIYDARLYRDKANEPSHLNVLHLLTFGGTKHTGLINWEASNKLFSSPCLATRVVTRYPAVLRYTLADQSRCYNVVKTF